MSANPMSAPNDRMEHGLIVEWHGDVRIDGALAAMLRHHTATADEFGDAVAFCREPFTQAQLGLLLKRMGPGLPIAAHTVHVECRRRARILKCDMRITEHIRWNSGCITLHNDQMPGIIASAAVGRPLRDILEHPYIPEGLVITNIEDEMGLWTLTLHRESVGAKQLQI